MKNEIHDLHVPVRPMPTHSLRYSSRTAAYTRTLPGRASNFMSLPLSYNTLVFGYLFVAYIEVHAFSLDDLHIVTYCYHGYLSLQTATIITNSN